MGPDKETKDLLRAGECLAGIGVAPIVKTLLDQIRAQVERPRDASSSKQVYANILYLTTEIQRRCLKLLGD